MRKLFAFFIALVLVMPLLLAAQAVIASSSFILDRDFYTDSIDSEDVYEHIITDAVIWGLISEQLALPPGTDTTRLQAVLNKAINRSTIRSQVSGLVNEFFDYMQGDRETFNPQLDVSSVKSSLAGDLQEEFLLELMAVLPVCDESQLQALNSGELAPCKPAGIPDELLIENFLKPAFPFILVSIPNQISLEGRWSAWQEQDDWRSLVPGQALPASLILAAVVLGFMAASLWYMAALLADSTWRVRLQWLGWMLFFPSALIFLTGLLIGSGISAPLLEFGLERVSLPFGPAFEAIFKAVLSGGIPRAAGAFLMVGGISSAFALALFLWGWVIPRR